MGLGKVHTLAESRNVLGSQAVQLLRVLVHASLQLVPLRLQCLLVLRLLLQLRLGVLQRLRKLKSLLDLPLFTDKAYLCLVRLVETGPLLLLEGEHALEVLHELGRELLRVTEEHLRLRAQRASDLLEPRGLLAGADHIPAVGLRQV